MTYDADVAELAEALRTDPSRAPSLKEAALRSRVQARSDVPKGILLVGLCAATVAISVAAQRTYVFMPFFLFFSGLALISRGAKAHRHARVLEDALAQAGLAAGPVPDAVAAPAPSTMWATSILPGAAPSPAAPVPAPVRWEAPADPAVGAAPVVPPPNVWST